MSLTVQETSQIVATYQRKPEDTGSADVQIALLSEKIKRLTEHFKTHSHDYHSRRGLYRMVSRRRKLLSYLKKSDLARYRELVKQLNLRA